MKKVTKNGNNGFSLVELLVVVAIIAIFGFFAFTGISLVTSRPADECAKKIQIALEGNRNTTMGKFSASITFSADDDGVYVEEIINGTSEGVVKIGQSGVDVTYKLNGTSTSLSAAPSTISFDRADGSLNAQVDGSYLQSFEVSRGERKLTVTIDKLTGRVDVE